MADPSSRSRAVRGNHALLGEGSHFHETHGFFIDGVDDTTAKLTPDWQERAVRRDVALDGRMVEVIAPEPNDIVAAKLARGDPKDVLFARICMTSGIARHEEIRKRLELIMPQEMLGLALGRLRQARHAPGLGTAGRAR